MTEFERLTLALQMVSAHAAIGLWKCQPGLTEADLRSLQENVDLLNAAARRMLQMEAGRCELPQANETSLTCRSILKLFETNASSTTFEAT